MPRTPARLLVALALTAGLAACGGDKTPSATPSSAAPSTTSTPSPTPTLPTAAADNATAKAALLTAAELGKPWVQPKSVNKVKGGKGELCPGHPNEAKIADPRGEQTRQFTEGKQVGASILSLTIWTYPFGSAQKWRDAVVASNKACSAWKAVEGNYVVLTRMAAPPSIAGADEVLGHYERVYADAKHRTLQYVRQIVEARFGRVVVYAEYAFLTDKKDPTGSDTAKLAALLTKAVAKAAPKFAPTNPEAGA